MVKTIGRFKKGKVTLAVLEGKFNGKPTTAYTLNKSVLKDNKWQKTDFLTITDLQDISSLATRVCCGYVKFEKVDPKPNNQTQQSCL